jgi:thiamine biosynthesis lipoprotein
LGKKFNRPWVIGIRDPLKPAVSKTVELVDKGISTSGDYERYIEVDNKKFPHIIDPKTGYPADTGIASVTVVAKNCTTSDAWSTALFVLGKEKGGILASKMGVEQIEIIPRK